MNRFTVKENKKLGEKYYYAKHDSGLDIYIIPKEHETSFALFGTRYGSNDSIFAKDGGDFITVPDGIAHFLEHKLFENSDGVDTFSKFSEFGADCNAFTSNDMTCYLFSATDNIYDSLKVLLSFVSEPYFTDENVSKEMGIIEQELIMYDDNAYRWLYQSTLASLFVNNPLRIPVGGTVESIHKINKEILYKCYETFYNLDNMALVLCGRFEPEEVYKICGLLKKSEPIEIRRKEYSEPKEVARGTISREFPISTPLFMIGLKDSIASPERGNQILKRYLEHSIIIEILFGKSGDFYNELYEKGLINDSFSADYTIHKDSGYLLVGGESDKYEEVFELLKEHIEKVKGEGITADEFERARRIIYARCVQSWNSAEETAEQFISFLFCDADMTEATDVISKITLDNIKKRLAEFYDTSYMVIGTALPKSKDRKENKNVL